MQTERPASATPASLKLRSGLEIDDPLERLFRFSREEYCYYDGIVGSDPNHIEPVDVLVTWSVNSNIYRTESSPKPFIDPASKMRSIHRGLAAHCDNRLKEIPEDADVLSYDPDFQLVRRLLTSAIQVPGVGIAVATKVLHRKRRKFIPMLDSIVVEYYLTASEIASLKDERNWSNKGLSVSLAVKALAAFREDLRNAFADVDAYCRSLAASSFCLSPTRVLEILIWTKRRRIYDK